jgi:hypothetical protein
MVNAWRGSIKERKAQKQVLATYLGLATWRINTRRLAGQTNEYRRSVWCWIDGIRLAAQPKAQSEVLQTKNMNPNQQQDSTMMNTNSTKLLKNENCGSKAYRAWESVHFLAFLVELGTKAKTNYKAEDNTSRAT